MNMMPITLSLFIRGCNSIRCKLSQYGCYGLVHTITQWIQSVTGKPRSNPERGACGHAMLFANCHNRIKSRRKRDDLRTNL